MIFRLLILNEWDHPSPHARSTRVADEGNYFRIDGQKPVGDNYERRSEVNNDAAPVERHQDGCSVIVTVSHPRKPHIEYVFESGVSSSKNPPNLTRCVLAVPFRNGWAVTVWAVHRLDCVPNVLMDNVWSWKVREQTSQGPVELGRCSVHQLEEVRRDYSEKGRYPDHVVRRKHPHLGKGSDGFSKLVVVSNSGILLCETGGKMPRQLVDHRPPFCDGRSRVPTVLRHAEGPFECGPIIEGSDNLEEFVTQIRPCVGAPTLTAKEYFRCCQCVHGRMGTGADGKYDGYHFT
mmetsp:Transcript_51315/g.119397  ORF Transcript_51315/g.119397 Transcript_51315/m.119397 type:complete len:291 (+) Transcript_51315:22-894(+)